MLCAESVTCGNIRVGGVGRPDFARHADLYLSGNQEREVRAHGQTFDPFKLTASHESFDCYRTGVVAALSRDTKANLGTCHIILAYGVPIAGGEREF